MTPEQHAKAIEDAAVAYAEATHTQDSYGARHGLKAAIIAGVGAAPAAPDVAAELEEVKTVCAEAYQVVGILLSDAGRFDSPEAEKILDNLGEQRLRHTDVLPWESKPAPEWMPIESAPKDGSDVLVMYMHIDTQIVHNGFWLEGEGVDAPDIGWWSYEHGEVSRIQLDDWMTPTHWMTLPSAPKP